MTRQKRKIRFSRFYIIAIPVVVFVILNVYWAIEAASFGAKISSLEQKAQKLVIENNQLSGQLVGATSLGQLSQKTESLGFGRPAKIIYLGHDDLVAKLP